MVSSFPVAKAVRKIRSCQTHGEEKPAGSSLFQSKFVAGPNSAGGLSESETPAQFGPRNCGQIALAWMDRQESITVLPRQTSNKSCFDSVIRMPLVSRFATEMSR